MKIMYFDCAMGAAGDMLTASMLELIEDRNAVLEKLNNIGIPGVTFTAEDSVKCGICGTHLKVMINGNTEDEHMHEDHSHGHHDHGHHEQPQECSEHDHHEHLHDNAEHSHHGYSHECSGQTLETDIHGSHEHSHMSMNDIKQTVESLAVEENVKKDILAVYGIIADAESRVHGVPVSEIHFHEVGNLDAIADVTAACVLLNELKPDRVVCSPIHVGSGTVRCAHGVLPVPAPATALILSGIPIYSRDIRGELCTPTGAAILKYFSDGFTSIPLMKIDKIGYGMGTKNFDTANCVRVMLGTEDEPCKDIVYQLSCNIDDMTGEDIGFAVNKLLEMGARDVYTCPIIMKKNRPGIILNVICSSEDRLKFAEAIFRYTSTIGIREAQFERYILKRHEETVATEFGDIRRKISEGYGTRKIKYEYDDICEIAQKRRISVDEIRQYLKDDQYN